MTNLKIARIAARQTWRELDRARLSFSIVAIAIGVAALGAADGAANTFATLMAGNLAQWIASDLCVITGEGLDSRQTQLIADLQREGLPMSRLEDTIANVSTVAHPDPVAAMVRVVDRAYPLRGEVRFTPPGILPDVLATGALASRTALSRLQLAVGDTFYLNGKPTKIAAELQMLPDQLTLPPTLLPIFVVNNFSTAAGGQRGYDYLRFLFRLPDIAQLNSYRQRLAEAFPGRKIHDALHPDEQASLVLDMARSAMRCFSWISLFIALASVQIALWARLERQLDTAAMLQCLGARRAQLAIWMSAEPLVLLTAGALLGLALAYLLERQIVHGIASFIGYAGVPPIDIRGPIEAALVAPFAGFMLLAPYLATISRVRPARLIRRGAEGARFHWQPLAIAACGIAAIVYFVAGRAVLLCLPPALLLFALCQLILRLPRSKHGPLWFRYATANLRRPANFSGLSLFALAAAVALSIAIWTIQHAMTREIAETFPRDSGLLLLNIPPTQAGELSRLLVEELGATAPPSIVPCFPLRVVSVDGVPNRTTELGLDRRWLAAQTADAEQIIPFLAGVHWRPSPTEPEVLAPRAVARALGAHHGSLIEFETTRRRWTARLTESIAAGPMIRLRCCFLFNNANPSQPTAALHGIAKLPDAKILAAQRRLYEWSPLLSTVDVATPSAAISEWLVSILYALNALAALLFAAAFTLFTGAVIATREWRRAEIAIAKVLGATPTTALAIAAAEFAVLGALAGLVGTLLAAPIVTVVWNRFFEGHAAFPSLWLYVLVPALTALLTSLIGCAVVAPQAAMKPLAALRRS